MSYEIVGLLHEKFKPQQINENFRKREFILQHSLTRNDKKITDYIKFQLTGDRCDLIDDVALGDYLKVYFNIKGRKLDRDGNINYFLNLDVWRLESLAVEVKTVTKTATDTTPNTTTTADKMEGLEINDYLPF